jgi:CheY-like chemotaxis protein
MESATSGLLRALTVDDQRDSVYLLGKLLETLGCEVTTCQVASDCTDHAHRTHPHLIVLDISMPGKNGFTLAEELLNANLPKFYLVALSGFGGPKIEAACKTAGFDKHLLKPAGIDDLRKLVQSTRQIAAVS